MPKTRKNLGNFKETVELKNGDEADVCVEILSYHPGYPGCRYRANGDPGDPPEPAEVEFTLKDENGVCLDEEISEEEWERVEEKCFAEIDECKRNREIDAAEAKYDAMKEEGVI